MLSVVEQGGEIGRQVVGKRIICHQVQRRSKFAQHDKQMNNEVGSFSREREGGNSASWAQSFGMSRIAVGDTHVAKVEDEAVRMELVSESG